MAHAVSVGCGVVTTTPASEDRLYFRQLLSGRDFAVDDPLASQMVNFVYAVGDRTTGDCVLVDPAYAVADLLAAVAADGMTVTGVIASHYHPDHIGGSMMGYTIEGVPELLERVDVPRPRSGRRGARGLLGRSGCRWTELVTHQPGDVVARRNGRRRAAAHSGAHPRQPVPPRRRPPCLRGHAVPRWLRTHRSARKRRRGDVRQPPTSRHAPRLARSSFPATATRSRPAPRCRRSASRTTSSSRRPRTSG